MNRHYGNEDCASYIDMRELLARPDIDAVVIATGDRWHATASILAARAGKHIYCEKPCTMTVAESQELDAEVRKAGRIYQGGMQRRNVDNFQVAVALARSGKLALSDDSLLTDGLPPVMHGVDASRHIREFLDAIKTRGDTSCNSTVTRHSEIACHAAAISWKLGRRLRFDPSSESFFDEPEADALRSRPRREPFTV